MKKIVLLFFMICIWSLCSYSNSNMIIGDMKNLDILEKPIAGESTRVPFIATIVVKKSEILKFSQEDFIEIDPEIKGDSGLLIDKESIRIRWANVQRLGKNILTFRKLNSNEMLNDDLRFVIEGKFLITNKNILVRPHSDIYLGGVYKNKSQKTADFWLGLENDRLDMIRALKIDVIKNMYLGKAVAGEALSTETFGGHPAEIALEALENSKLKITIPKEATIKSNMSGAADLKVNLKFINANSSIKGDKLERDVVTDSRGKVQEIMIGGETAKTTKNHYGRYKGEFIVRVEYVE